MIKIKQKDVKGGRWFQAEEENGQLLGFATSSLNENNQVVLDSIHVVPIARKKGIGTALLDSVLKWGNEEGVNEVVGEFFPEFRGGEDERAARKFYERRGISIDSENNLKGRVR
ncbi:MAG: GNAT family N-acetyltransferase [Candidatus Woesebacteria bacterium]|nr:GNAT family N-acetyltransferase [Candidatus Woesebacteria bacterium]